MFDPTLYFVTPEIGCEKLVREAVLGGVTMVQLRDKKASSQEMIAFGLKIRDFLKERKVPLVINDRLDVALELDAEGLHIGQEDLSIEKARDLLGPEKIIGLSLENLEQFENSDGADYLAASPIFPSKTKETASWWGLEQVAVLRKKTTLPLVTIGGIEMQHLQPIRQIGVDGVAVVSLIADAKNPQIAAREILQEWRK